MNNTGQTDHGRAETSEELVNTDIQKKRQPDVLYVSSRSGLSLWQAAGEQGGHRASGQHCEWEAQSPVEAAMWPGTVPQVSW